MRAAILGLSVSVMMLVGGCSPAVGSKEWCDQVIKGGLAEVAKMPADQQAAAAQCAANSLMGQ